MTEEMAGVDDGYVWSAITPALSLIPRSCWNCKNISLYRLTHWRVEGFPFDYHAWGCAECGQAYIMATGDDDGVEVGPKRIEGTARFTNARGQR